MCCQIWVRVMHHACDASNHDPAGVCVRVCVWVCVSLSMDLARTTQLASHAEQPIQAYNVSGPVIVMEVMMHSRPC